MTQHELQNWIIKWYQNAYDYILLFSQDHNILWQNRSCPMLHQIKETSDFFQLPNNSLSAKFMIPHAGALYQAQTTLHKEQDGLSLYLVRIDAEPCEQIQWEDPIWCNNVSNQVAAVRSQVFGISNAVSELYQLLETWDDEQSRLVMDSLMQHLNIIQGNCSKLLRPSVYIMELINYYQKQNLTREIFFLERELSEFVKSCQNVLGRSVKLHLQTQSFLCVHVNRARLVRCLLYLIILLEKRCPQMTRLTIQAEAQDDAVAITFTAETEGRDDAPRFHDQPIPLYHVPLLSPEEQIIQLFCNTYQATILTTDSEFQASCTLRLPTYQDQMPLTLESPFKEMNDDAFSIYHLILSEINFYRYY